MYMSKNNSEKLEKHLWRRLFCGKSCWATYHGLLKVKSNKGALLKRCSLQHWKIKKAPTTIIKENLRLKQLRLFYLNNQKKNKKRTPKISNNSISVGAVSSVIEQFDSRLASVFLKNLKHLPHPVLVLLF